MELEAISLKSWGRREVRICLQIVQGVQMIPAQSVMLIFPYDWMDFGVNALKWMFTGNNGTAYL